jgi:hypothetical protein
VTLRPAAQGPNPERRCNDRSCDPASAECFTVTGGKITRGVLVFDRPSSPRRSAEYEPVPGLGTASRLSRGSQKGKAMTALGSNAHIFAQPHRRQDLRWCFETALGCGPVATVEYPGIAEPMLVVRFPNGGSLSIEFTSQAPDDDQPRLGAWLELRAEDPAALMRAVLNAGLPEVKHPGHPYYFMAPGGQVFTIAPLH